MAVAKRCDRCGVFFEGNRAFKYNDGEQEFIVNSFRIGNWDQRKKIWKSIASGYDLCENCGREITDVIFAGENNQIKMRMVQQKKSGRYSFGEGKVVAEADPIEGEEPQPEVQTEEATDVTE